MWAAGLSLAKGWVRLGDLTPLLVRRVAIPIRTSILLRRALVEAILHQVVEGARLHNDKGHHGYSAEGSNKDDRVIVTALAVQSMKEAPRLRKYVSEAERKLKEFIKAKSLERHMGTGSENRPSVKQRQRYAIRGSKPERR
jgi:hypothetical protein